MNEPRTAGEIYDLGYQGYRGAMLGRANAIRTLILYSLRAAFGVGRGPRARMVPLFVGAILAVPAVGQIAAAAFTGSPMLINYARYMEFTTFFLALFVAAQAPELVVQDRQYGVLSLYLSRPLRGTDYALAKLGAIVLAMFLFTCVPQLILFTGKVFINDTPWTAFTEEAGKLLPIIGGSLATSLYMGAIGITLSSFASRRAFANAAVIAFFMVVPAATAIIHNIATGDVKRYIVLAHPMWLVTGFANWLYDIEARRRSVVGRADLPGEAYLIMIVAVALAFTAVLLWRYHKSET